MSSDNEGVVATIIFPVDRINVTSKHLYNRPCVWGNTSLAMIKDNSPFKKRDENQGVLFQIHSIQALHWHP